METLALGFSTPKTVTQMLTPTEAGYRLGRSSERIRQLTRPNSLDFLPCEQTPYGRLISSDTLGRFQRMRSALRDFPSNEALQGDAGRCGANGPRGVAEPEQRTGSR